MYTSVVQLLHSMRVLQCTVQGVHVQVTYHPRPCQQSLDELVLFQDYDRVLLDAADMDDCLLHLNSFCCALSLSEWEPVCHLCTFMGASAKLTDSVNTSDTPLYTCVCPK